ncbi:ankyrin repeat domain-containing protein [Streptomyces sp. NPDC004311]|uniref:ankyrin repeat domain-containing protein n=1 Tax=Streptomyces sp. NPDC004311 TaxID=3364698 RepID=UPI0036C63BBF
MDTADRLTRAAEEGDAAAVARLLAAGVPADSPDADRRTALDRAVREGHGAIVRLLLAAGADPLRPTGEYEELTPLLDAVTWGHTAVVRTLLDAGAPTGAQGKMRWLPLVVVPEGDAGHEIADLLLDHGADVDGLMKGWTPLEWAAARAELGMVRHLLARGATATARALDRASARGAQSPQDARRYAPVIHTLHAAHAQAPDRP